MKYRRVTVVTHLVGSVSYKATEMGWGSLTALSEQEGGASPGTAGDDLIRFITQQT